MKLSSWSRRPAFVSLFIIVFSTGWSQVSLSWKGKIATQDGVKIVDNPDRPCGGDLRLELREDLVITERSAGCDFGGLSSLFVDDDGCIFVLDNKNCRLLKFDSDGKLLLKIGKRGQGPGEFQDPERFIVDAAGGAIVSDGQRLHFFEPGSRYQRSLTMDHLIHEFLPANDGGFIAVSKIPLEAGGNDQAIAVFDSAGKAKRVLAQFRDQRRVVEKDKKGKDQALIAFHPFNPYLRLCPSGEGFVYGYPSEYKFHVCAIDGTLRRIVRKRESPRPIRREEKDAVIADTERFVHRMGMSFSRSAIEAALQFPDSRPYFSAISADAAGRVFIFKTFVSEKGEEDVETCVIDIFDGEGRFLYMATLPFRPEFVGNDQIYDISINKNGDPVVRRLEILNPVRF